LSVKNQEIGTEVRKEKGVGGGQKRGKKRGRNKKTGGRRRKDREKNVYKNKRLTVGFT